MFIKLIKIALFVASLILASGIDAAKILDVSAAQKDMRVMSGILETTLKDAKDDFPGRPVIKATYLAEQGYLFSIRLNGLGSWGIPGVASWDSGRLELDIPEIIEEAFAAVDYEFEPPVPPEPPELNTMLSKEYAEQNRAYQEEMRVMREKQRQLRRDISDLSRQIRLLEDDKERAKVEKDIAKLESQLANEKKNYYESLNSRKKEKLSNQIAKTDKAVDIILTTMCDYGSTIRNLKKGEKLNLLIQGGLTADGKSQDQMYIFDSNDLRNCRSADKLKKDALYYVL